MPGEVKSSDFIVRRAEKDDVLGISNLYQNVYEGMYTDPLMKDLRLMKGVLSTSEYCWCVATLDGEIVASMVYRIDVKNRLAKAFGAVVSPACRGHGITQRIMKFGYETMRQQPVPIEVIYATTRTVSFEPQKLTANLGYKKLGVFPNVHKTDTYETHCLTAFYAPDSLKNRFIDFTLHPDLQPLYQITRHECELPPLKSATFTVLENAHVNQHPPKLEIITAPLFVRHRFLDESVTIDDHEWFFPFHEANVLLTTPDQSVEIFAFLSEADKHCVLIGTRDTKKIGMSLILSAATKVLKDIGVRYIEFIMRADDTVKIQSALDCQYVPSAYFPAMQLSQGKRYDFVVFSRSFEILNFQGAHLDGINLQYLRLYAQYWQKIALEPIQGKS